MGKGNRHRGGHGGNDGRGGKDRGGDKAFYQRSFGGSGQKHAGTLGGTLGQAERHSDACFDGIKGVRSVRSKLEAQEKTLGAIPDFAVYLKAKREMVAAEKALFKVPAFVEYQKTRKELRSAVSILNDAKTKCEKCSFTDAVKKDEAARAAQQAPAPAAPPQAQAPAA